jgi:NAD(P)-dependent dehydrogenase (short-subunit alcohol dehydrogenase family)
LSHPALAADAVAVITGGAAGIGFAAAMRFAQLGLRVCIADLGEDRLSRAGDALSAAFPGAASNILTMSADVSRMDEVQRPEAAVRQRFGGADILMNNAGIQPGSRMFAPSANWERILGVNLWGVINGSQVFAPHMINHGRPGLIINTGSKQGTTTPPGDPAYNVAKAGVRSAPARIAEHTRLPTQCPSSDPSFRLH